MRNRAERDVERDNTPVASLTRSTRARITLTSLGFAAGVAQAVLLREAMAALGGSELAWGAVMALWLAGMGIGSWAGVRWGRAGWAVFAPALLSILTAAGVVLMRAAPALVGATAGEAVATWQAAWVWGLAVLVPALAGGWCFPVLAQSLNHSSPAALAYALEGFGALLGGAAFTFLLAPWGSAAAVLLTLAVSVLAVAYRSRWQWPAVALLALLIGAAGPAGGVLATAGWQWSGRIGRLAAWRETHDQRLELAAGEPAALYGDGGLVGTFPDRYRAVPRGHLLMLLHPRPRRVLAVGVAADGTLPVILTHPVERVDLVEEDPELLEVLPGWFGDEMARALGDPRVVAHRQDVVRVLDKGGTWDLIVLSDGDPTTIRRSRTRTAEFFTSCAAHLVADGLLVVRVGVTDTFVGGAGGRLLATLSSTLATAFPSVGALPGEEVLLLGAFSPRLTHPQLAELEERWRGLGLTDPSFSTAMLPILLDQERASSLNVFLAAELERASTRERPSVVSLAAARREGRGNPPLARLVAGLPDRAPWPLLVLVGLLVAGLLARLARGATLGPETAFVVGSVSMGWWLMLMTAWQVTVGSVFAQVGALSAVFMAGLVVGSSGARRWGERASARLPVVLGAGVVVSFLVAVGVPLRGPSSLIVALLFVGGALTGSAFPGVAQLCGTGEVRQGAGRGFAADEIGAAMAALVVGLVVMPWVGMAACAGALAVVEGVAATALVVRRRAAR